MTDKKPFAMFEFWADGGEFDPIPQFKIMWHPNPKVRNSHTSLEGLFELGIVIPDYPSYERWKFLEQQKADGATTFMNVLYWATGGSHDESED